MDLLFYTHRRPLEESRLTIKQNGQFLWFLLVIDSILRMEDEIEGEGKDDLFKALKARARENNNPTQLREIEDLEQKYGVVDGVQCFTGKSLESCRICFKDLFTEDPALAVKCYTKEACFYQPLNAALRQVDMDYLFKIRTLIRDIHTFLKNKNETRRNNEPSKVYNLYRGQAILVEQLNQLKRIQGSTNEFIAFNNFTSTSTSPDVAVGMAIANALESDTLAPVLFHIVADSGQTTHAFVDISQLSQYTSEDEVLIDIGAVFRVNRIVDSEPGDPYTIIQLTLLADEDYEHSELVNYLKRTKIRDEPLNQLIDFASLLEDMGEYSQSEQIYRHLLVKYKGDKRAESACQNGLALIAQRMGHYTSALSHQQESLDLQSDIVKPRANNIIELAKVYHNLGLQYGSCGEYDIALGHFLMSNELKHAVYCSYDHLLMADTYANIGNCYFETGKFELAEQNILRSMKIRERNGDPPTHPDFIQAHMTLGNIYGEKKEYDKAIEEHKKALNMARDTLSYNNQLLGMCYYNLGSDYKTLGKYDLARTFYENARTTYLFTMNNDHPEMQRLLAQLKEIEEHQ